MLCYMSAISTKAQCLFSCNRWRGDAMQLEGLQIGSYRLLRLIGGGGMGDVYLAEDVRVNRQVAIKVIQTRSSSYPDPDTTQDVMRLFQREMKAFANLD